MQWRETPPQKRESIVVGGIRISHLETQFGGGEGRNGKSLVSLARRTLGKKPWTQSQKIVLGGGSVGKAGRGAMPYDQGTKKL